MKFARTARVINSRGLHARAAAKFARTAGQFECEIQVQAGDLSVGGRSIMGLLMLGAPKGTELKLEAGAPDGKEALEALVWLIEDGFGES